MSVLERNLSVLLERFPDFDRAILNHGSATDEVVLERATSGGVTGLYRGTYIHSKRDPATEAERLVKASGAGNSSCAVCLGFGLGYVADSVRIAHPDMPVVIVEADASLFMTALKSRDLTATLSSASFSFLIGADIGVLPSVLQELRVGSVTVIPLRSTYLHHQEYYESARGMIAEYLQRREVNKNTLQRFGKLWIRNLVANLSTLAQAPGIAGLKQKMKGVPALVLAAGPSLDAVLPHLGALKQCCVVIAVDTSLKACIRAGIEPDFVTVVDPQYWNTRHLDYCHISTAVVVSESSTHPRTFRILDGIRAFCGSLFPLGKYLERYLGEFGILGAGGSVATSAWDFARYLGCSEIYCAGLDLGYPQLATHYHGSTFEERTHLLSSRIVPQEHLAFLSLRDAGPFAVPNNDGTTTLTDNRLSIYKGWFESQCAIHPDVKTYNLSRYGVAIEGMPYMPIENLEGSTENRHTIDTALQQCTMAMKSINVMERSAKLREAVLNLIDELNGLYEISERALEALAALSTCKPDQRQRILAELDGIDESIMRSDQREIAGFLMHGVATDILDSSTSGGSSDALASSEQLYTALQNSIEHHLDLLKLSCRMLRPSERRRGSSS